MKNNGQHQEHLLDAERLKMVLEGSQQGFWDWNIETGAVKRNDRWAQMLGYSSIQEFEENVGTWTNSIHPDDRDAAWNSINSHIEGLTDYHKLEYRMLTKQGGYTWILDHGKIVQHAADGSPIRMSGTHMDITERKGLEQERDRLIQSLQLAMNEIKTLQGTIPICSYCHSIRDEEGAWNMLEYYISKHSEASFSHGICPDCVDQVRQDTGIKG